MSGGLLARLGEESAIRRDEPLVGVVSHLKVLLASRRGGSPSSPGYGVDDLRDAVHVFPSGAQRIAVRLRETIERYEPRLARGVSLVLQGYDASGTLSYRLTARLADDRSTILIADIVVDPSGAIRLIPAQMGL